MPEISDWPTLVAALSFGYLLGSIPSGVILARAFGLGDPRTIGSGNIGATNVLRTGSKKAAVLTLLFDLLKGTAAVLLAAPWGGACAAAAGLGAFLGHCYPVWLRFRGGKGVATFIGVFLGLHWPTFLGIAATWLAVAFITKISSLSALVAAAAGPVLLAVFGRGEYLWVAIPMTAMLWVFHRANIARIRNGTEPRISFGGKG